MLIEITPDTYGNNALHLAEMHRLRFRVFKERLNWDVQFSGDMELDDYDALRPTYLLQVSQRGRVQGCVRFLPTTGPYMLSRTFPVLLGESEAPSSPRVWESSRFALDTSRDDQESGGQGIATATYELFAGMIAFGLRRELSSIVTVTDVRMERILKRSGWPLDRIADPLEIGPTRAVAGYLEVSVSALADVCRRGRLDQATFMEPDVEVAA